MWSQKPDEPIFADSKHSSEKIINTSFCVGFFLWPTCCCTVNFSLVRVYDISVTGHPSLFTFFTFGDLCKPTFPLSTCCSGFLYPCKTAYGPKERIDNPPISMKEPTPRDVCASTQQSPLINLLGGPWASADKWCDDQRDDSAWGWVSGASRDRGRRGSCISAVLGLVYK